MYPIKGLIISLLYFALPTFLSPHFILTIRYSYRQVEKWKIQYHTNTSFLMECLNSVPPTFTSELPSVKTWTIIAVMHTTQAVVKLKPEKTSGLNGIRTQDLCDHGAVLYQLSYQANWELLTLWVRNIPVEGEEYKWIYKRSYIRTGEKDMKIWLINAALWEKFGPERDLNPWPLRYRCSASPAELSSQLGAGHFDQSCLNIFPHSSNIWSFICPLQSYLLFTDVPLFFFAASARTCLSK